MNYKNRAIYGTGRKPMRGDGWFSDTLGTIWDGAKSIAKKNKVLSRAAGVLARNIPVVGDYIGDAAEKFVHDKTGYGRRKTKQSIRVKKGLVKRNKKGQFVKS